MPDLSSLVSSDSRPLLARVRRVKLYQIAEGEGIPHPVDAPKTVMLPLLEHVSPEAVRKYIEVRQIFQEDENGRQHIEEYPVETENNSARHQERVAMELLKRTSVDEKKENDERIEALQKENESLKSLITERLDKLEGATPQLPLDSLLPWQLKRLAKTAGIDYKDMSKEEMVEALGGN